MGLAEACVFKEGYKIQEEGQRKENYFLAIKNGENNGNRSSEEHRHH